MPNVPGGGWNLGARLCDINFREEEKFTHQDRLVFAKRVSIILDTSKHICQFKKAKWVDDKIKTCIYSHIYPFRRALLLNSQFLTLNEKYEIAKRLPSSLIIFWRGDEMLLQQSWEPLSPASPAPIDQISIEYTCILVIELSSWYQRCRYRFRGYT